MTNEKAYRFSTFRLDTQNWRLRKNNEFRPLRPKTFAVLRYLLDNAGRLVTKEDLFAAIWPNTKVAESALPVCMNELRQVLDDDSHRPRFVETVHRIGYRFIAPVAISHEDDDEPSSVAPPRPIIVGREPELARLQECWERALGTTRQVVFVVGEPGIGKTTIVDQLLGSAPVAGFALVGRGHCAQQSGKGDAYLPVFEALGQLCGGGRSKEAREVLVRQAPNWTAHLPQLRDSGSSNGHDDGGRATSAQMLGEIATALNAIAAIHPVMLVCEDLHLSDRATVELLAYLAKRRDPARLMIIGTYRSTLPRRDPAQLTAMVRELQARQQCKIVRLGGLRETEVADYLRGNIDRPVAPKLAGQVHRRTGGNPLFMAAIVDHLESLRGTARSWPEDLRDLGVPDNVHAMIEQQIEELADDDQRILKLASVAGASGLEFSSAALAAALEDEVPAASQDQIEEQCEQLTQRVNFLHATGISRWPDGTIAASYAFGHALYQEVLYTMLSAGQRARAHLRIARRLETAYGPQAAGVASELAMHFEAGGDYRRAALHLHTAAENAKKRGVSREALVQIDRALTLLATVPRDDDRLRLELNLETTRSMVLAARRAPPSKIEAAFRRIYELAHELGRLAPALLVSQGVGKFLLSPMESRAAEILIKAGLRQARSNDIAAEKGFAPMRPIAHMVLSAALNMQGKYRPALSHATRSIETYDPSHEFAGNPHQVQATVEAAVALWFLGYPDQAEKRALEAIATAEKTSNAPALSLVIARAATIYALGREWEKSLALAERLIAFAADKDLQPWPTWAIYLRGAARANLGAQIEGCRMMRSALAVFDGRDGRERIGPLTDTAHARVSMQFMEVSAGLLRPHEAAQFVQEAIDECLETGAAGFLANLYYLKGLLVIAGENPDRAAQVEADKCLRKAIETAHSQSAKSLELRAAIELSRLWQRQRKPAPAHKLLSSIYRRFTEGHNTPDLKDAKTLIAELRSSAAQPK